MGDLEDEIVYGRDHDSARIFISSKMDGSLDRERRITAAAVDRMDAYKAWWWERDAAGGALHSEVECVRYAGSSDGLILLIAGGLSRIIYAEYEAAQRASAQTYIFIREHDELPDDVQTFVKNQQKGLVVTRNFLNVAELETFVYDSLNRATVRALRSTQVARRGAEA